MHDHALPNLLIFAGMVTVMLGGFVALDYAVGCVLRKKNEMAKDR